MESHISMKLVSAVSGSEMRELQFLQNVMGHILSVL